MNKIRFLFFIILIFLTLRAFAQQTITVINNTAIARKGEFVEINLSTLKFSFESKTYVLTNNRHKEIAYQLIYEGNKKPKALIFQADVAANSLVSYFLTEGKPAAVKPKTFARFVKERKDDFAWENDMAAYRMYGPALASENPSNGVDFWAKCTENLVVDQRYRDDIYNNISYHVDHGLGLDFYKVAHTLGCGGIAPYTGKLWVGNHFDHYKVIEVGPLRSVFQLVYDSVKVGNSYYQQEITITVDAGSLLNKASVKYIGASQKMELAAGIYLHDGKGVLKQHVETGTSAYAEVPVSDYKVPVGRNYIGIYIPEKVNNALVVDEEGLLTSSYQVGDTFIYYFGGGWSKWHFPTDESWFNSVDNYSKSLRNPLAIKVK